MTDTMPRRYILNCTIIKKNNIGYNKHTNAQKQAKQDESPEFFSGSARTVVTEFFYGFPYRRNIFFYHITRVFRTEPDWFYKSLQFLYKKSLHSNGMINVVSFLTNFISILPESFISMSPFLQKASMCQIGEIFIVVSLRFRQFFPYTWKTWCSAIKSESIWILNVFPITFSFIIAHVKQLETKKGIQMINRNFLILERYYWFWKRRVAINTWNHRDRFLIPSLASHGRCPCRFSLAFVVA